MYLQAAFYSESLKYLKLQYPELFTYRVENFRFVVVSSQDPFRPLVYKTSDVDLYAGKYGGKLQKYNEEVRGFDQLIEDMLWHVETSNYNYPRNIYELGGEVELNVF